MEEYKMKQIRFGTISMITNCIKDSPQKIYENYKSRMEIEIVFDAYKNLLGADRTFMETDSSMDMGLYKPHRNNALLSNIQYFEKQGFTNCELRMIY